MAIGKLDLANLNFIDTVSILLGTGTGSFGAKTDFGTGSDPGSVAVGDFNGDGKLDLAVTNGNSATASILLGTGTGSFGARTGFGTGGGPDSVAVGDFNGDGKLDLTTANQSRNTVSILLNDCTNTPPSIIAAPVTRTAGNPSVNSQIATVDDAQDAPNTLSVTVNGGTSATVNGVTVTLNPTAPNASGQVFADVVAACTATTATFTLRVTDSGGLFTETTLTVTVNPDNQPPTITCPMNQTLSANANCQAIATYTATATDNCTTSPAVTCTPASGSTFPKGTTTVNCTATDGAGNTAMCSFTVTVNDTTPPIIMCPANVTKPNDPNQCGAAVTYPNPTMSDNCPGATFNCTPASGSFFSVGSTTVTCTAKDAANNMSSCMFTVTVNDTQPPTIMCPGNITTTAPASCPLAGSTPVSFATPGTANGQVTDNCPLPPNYMAVCTPPSGTSFPVGTTTVTCTATDTSGNTAMCTFPVTVFSFCLQDETNPGNVVLVDLVSGAYRYCCNGALVATGTGILTVKGCIATINDAKGDRKVQIQVDTSVNKGIAFIQRGQNQKCFIQDNDLTNNTCLCQ